MRSVTFNKYQLIQTDVSFVGFNLILPVRLENFHSNNANHSLASFVIGLWSRRNGCVIKIIRYDMLKLPFNMMQPLDLSR